MFIELKHVKRKKNEYENGGTKSSRCLIVARAVIMKGCSKLKNKGIWGIWDILSLQMIICFSAFHILGTNRKSIHFFWVTWTWCYRTCKSDGKVLHTCSLSDRFLAALFLGPPDPTHASLGAPFPLRTFPFQGFFSRKHYFLLGDSLKIPILNSFLAWGYKSWEVYKKV